MIKKEIMLNREDFERFRFLIKKLTGIIVHPDQIFQLENRLADLLIKCECNSYQEMYDKIITKHAKYQELFIDTITNHETYWFRDISLWEVLEKELLPCFLQNLQNKNIFSFKIWCTASSSGEEPYSLSILLDELLDKIAFAKGDAGIKKIIKEMISILATDISPKRIEIAQKGIFTSFAVNRGLSTERLKKYFLQTPEEKEKFVLNDKIKRSIKFTTFNLMDSFINLGLFDIIFCRNVAIYFPEEHKRILIEKVVNCLNDGGYLILGSSETLLGGDEHYLNKLKKISFGTVNIYQKC